MSVDLPRSLPEVMRRAIDGTLNDCHVALPGRVLAWDPVANLADVDVQVQHSVWDDDSRRTYEDLGTMPGVPVMWPRAGGMVLTFPMAVGDTGLLIFCSDSIAEWRTSNQKSSPVDATRMNTGWPVFVPGLFADVKPPTAGDSTARGSAAIFGKDGAEQQIRIDGSGIKLGASSTEHVMTAEATCLLIYNVLVALMAAAGGGPLTAAILQPLIGSAISTALTAQVAAAPSGLAAQTTAAASQQAAFAAGTAPATALFAAWVTQLANLSSKTLDVSGLFPSAGSSTAKTE